MKHYRQRKKNYYRDLDLPIRYLLDEGISEYELSVYCKKEVGFKLNKQLESSIHHQREVCRFTGRSSYDILIKNYKKKHAWMDECSQ